MGENYSCVVVECCRRRVFIFVNRKRSTIALGIYRQNENGQKDNQWSKKHYSKTKEWAQRTSLKPRGLMSRSPGWGLPHLDGVEVVVMQKYGSHAPCTLISHIPTKHNCFFVRTSYQDRRVGILFGFSPLGCEVIVRFVDIDGIADHHYLIQHKQNIFFVTSLSVSLHNLLHFYIYIYVWKLNQTVLELDFRAVKFLFFPRRDLNSHHWFTAAPFA